MLIRRLFRRLFGGKTKSAEPVRDPSSLTDPEKLLLSKFLQPRELGKFLQPRELDDLDDFDSDDFDSNESWRQVLGDPRRVIAQFRQAGLVAEANLAQRLDAMLTVTDLKKALQKHSLKVSGKKADLIERLVTEAPQEARRLAARHRALVCTNKGREIAEAYLKEVNTKREQAEQTALAMVQQRRFTDAARAVAAFEQTQVFPRGMGMNWGDPELPERLGDEIKRIFEVRPSILRDMPDDRWETVRIAAAMMELWGTNSARAWLPKGFDTGTRFDPSTAARMVLFHVCHLRTLKHCQEMGDKRVNILTAGAGSSCDRCLEMEGKKFPLEKVPELPHPECEHELGCRCLIIPAESQTYGERGGDDAHS